MTKKLIVCSLCVFLIVGVIAVVVVRGNTTRGERVLKDLGEHEFFPKRSTIDATPIAPGQADGEGVEYIEIRSARKVAVRLPRDEVNTVRTHFGAKSVEVFCDEYSVEMFYRGKGAGTRAISMAERRFTTSSGP